MSYSFTQLSLCLCFFWQVASQFVLEQFPSEVVKCELVFSYLDRRVVSSHSPSWCLRTSLCHHFTHIATINSEEEWCVCPYHTVTLCILATLRSLVSTEDIHLFTGYDPKDRQPDGSENRFIPSGSWPCYTDFTWRKSFAKFNEYLAPSNPSYAARSVSTHCGKRQSASCEI